MPSPNRPRAYRRPRSYVWQFTCGFRERPERIGIATLTAALDDTLARWGLTAETPRQRMQRECDAAKRRAHV